VYLLPWIVAGVIGTWLVERIINKQRHWDLSTPGLREAWNAGDFLRFHGWNKRAGAKTDPVARKEKK
jgi:hypothetical protein